MPSAVKELYELEVKENELAFLHLGYSGVLLRTAHTCMAFDIANLLSRDEIADMKCLELLVFTHGHYDHYEKRTTLGVHEHTNCSIVAETGVYNDLKGSVASEKLFESRAGSTIKVGEREISAIAGVHVGPILLYVVDIAGLKLFYGGDSGYVPLKAYRADVAIIPTGDPSPTASPDDALKMALDLRPKVVIPVHGSKTQHDKFKSSVEKQLPETKVVIPEERRAAKIQL